MSLSQATLFQLWGTVGHRRNTEHNNRPALISLNNNTTDHNNLNNNTNAINQENNNNAIQQTSTEQRRGGTQHQLRRRQNRNLRIVRQQNIIQEQQQNLTTDEEWGDKYDDSKGDDIFRIGFRNINGLPLDSTHLKNYELMSDIRKGNFDAFSITETNVAWHILNESDRLSERLRGKLEFIRFSSSYNKDFTNTEKFQYGGTMIMSQGSASGRVTSTGSDPCQLGRWSWMSFRGKNNLIVKLVSVYRPVISYGASSTYQQHQLYMNQYHLTGCPRDKLLSDLQMQLDAWVEQGERIIVQGDFNEDIRSNRLQRFFGQWGLKEIFFDKHGDQMPNTYINGTMPIDGIFASSDLVIEKCGYSDFQWGTKSDHRLLWADFKSTNLFGDSNIPMWNPLSRRLKMLDIRVVSKFIDLRKKHLAEHQLEQRLRLLRERILVEDFSEDLKKEFEEIDKLRTEGILYADRKCRKIKAAEVPWSPLLQESINRIRYYRVCIAKWRDNRQVNCRTLKTLQKKAKILDIPNSVQEAEKKLKEEYNTYNRYKKEATSRRNTYLEDMAVARAEHFNTSAISDLKVLIEHERQRAIGRKMRRVLGKARSGVTSVVAPNEDHEWVLLTDKMAIEKACQEENVRRFTQANDTPALLPEQVELLGWTADSEVSNNILQGNEDIRLHPNINKLVKYLQINESIQNLPGIDKYITTEEFQEGWRKCREFTATGKSGIHFGHFKASCLDPELTEFDKDMLNISLTTGYTLQRWLYGIDVMIPKKADSIRVDKLRTIVLLEADFNFLNKLIGKRVMFHAEKHNNIAKEQYGSRKKKSSILHATNKQITFDILNIKKQDSTLLILDAKSCYDRIAPPIASLCLRRQGAPQEFCNVIFNTIDNMTHITRTSYGDSEISYKRSGNQRFHGILQGNGAGPTIWAMISSPLLESLKDQGFGISIEHPSTRTEERISAFSFVDDTDLIQAIPEGYEAHAISQEALQRWNEDLCTTGGALVGDKCSWFAIKHEWKQHKWTYCNIQQTPGDVFIHANDGSNVTLHRHNPNDAVLALGVMFSPTGNMSHQIKYMMDKATNWANVVRSSGLSRSEVWYSLRTMIMKSLEYPLLSTTMKEQDLERVMSIILKVGLSKSGICRTISRKLVYSSKKYFGFGIRHLYVTQGIGKLKLLLQPQDSLTRHLINTAWEYCRIESGLGPNFMTYHVDDYLSFYMTRSWIFSIWEFISKFRIVLRTLHEPEQRSDDDDFIMAKVISGNFSKTDIRLFNWCRIYLQVEKLSDILTADGKRIRQQIWNGIQHTKCTRWNWPRQPNPGQKGWKVWKFILQSILTTNTSGVLTFPRDPLKYNSYWSWYYSPSESRLYEKVNDALYYRSIVRSHLRRSNRHNLRFGAPIVTNSIPTDLQMCTIYNVNDEVVLESKGLMAVTDNSPSTLIKWEHTIVTTVHGSDEDFYNEWIQQKLVIVSDGSAKQDRATGAWIMTSESLYAQGKYIEGSASSFGPPSAQDSHRAESIGLLGGLFLLRQKLQEWNHNSGCILFACDNISALKYMFDHNLYPYISANVPDYDIMQSGRSMMISSVSYAFQHVKGHQDSRGGELDFLATLNVRMDLLAKLRREQDELTPAIPQCSILPNERWQVATSINKLCRDFDEGIYDFISHQTMKSYWTHNHDDTNRHFDSVDWDGIHTAIKQLPVHRQHWISKHVVGECGVNVVMLQRKEKKSDACKRCGDVETTTHVWKCKHVEAEQIWHKALVDLEQFLVQNNTDPVLSQSIILNLRRWYYDTPPIQQQNDSYTIQQNNIGWDFFIEGWLGLHWRASQARFLLSIQSKMSVRRWVGALILKLWAIAWDLWEHRNGVEHEHDRQDLHIQLNDQIRAEVDNYNIDEYPDMAYMFRMEEMDKIYDSSIGYKKSWLRNVVGAKSKGTRRTNTPEITQMRRTMRLFLNMRI
jgi:Reverse transcriptase (RNA-dependent DNA polymerase)